MGKEQQRESNVQDVGNRSANILVLVTGEDRDIPNHDHENVNVVHQSFVSYADPNSIADFFNRSIEHYHSDIVIYLDPYSNILEHTIDTINKIVYSGGFSGFGGIYSDVMVENVCTKYLPTYDISIMSKNVPLNVPFAAIFNVAPTFNNRFKQLCLWDGMLNLMEKTILYHSAVPLFTLSHEYTNNVWMKELEEINNVHFS